MNISARTALMAGVATLTVSAVAIAPSVQPAPSPRPMPAVQLAAAVQPPDEPGPHLLQILLNDPLRLLGPAKPFGTITPPPAPIEFALAPNLADTVDNIYLAVEPWVEYGFRVATDIVQWIPWVGWFAGQIMVFYTFGEGMVASGAFNITDWLRGDGGAIENVVDFGIDVGLAFIWLGIDEYNYFLPPLPPLPFPRPPRPPHEGRPGPNLALEMLLGLTGMSGVGVENAGTLQALLDRVLNNPLNADGGVDGAFKGGASLSSLFRNGIADIGDLFGAPLSPGELKKTEISTVPSFVKTPFAPLNSLRTRINTGADIDEAAGGPLTEVTKTVHNVRNEIRANFNATDRRTDGAATNGLVQAQGEVRGAVGRAATDVVNALRVGKPSKAAEDGANGPTTAAKSFGDTATKVVKQVRQAAKDARDAAKDRTAADDE